MGKPMFSETFFGRAIEYFMEENPKSCKNMPKGIYAYDKKTGASITRLSNWVGHSTIEQASLGTARIMGMYGASDDAGMFSELMQRRGTGSDKINNKRLNFIDLKLWKIIN